MVCHHLDREEVVPVGKSLGLTTALWYGVGIGVSSRSSGMGKREHGVSQGG
jgi:hypothetical protein